MNLIACLCLASLCPGQETDLRLSLADGSVLPVKTVRLDPDQGATFQEGGQSRTVPLQEVVELSFPSSPAPSDGGTGEPVMVHLQDGSFLRGRVRGGGEDQLDVRILPGLELMLPVDSLRALFFGDRAVRLSPSLYRQPGDEDLLFRRPEAGGDFTTGFLLSFDAEQLNFEYRLGVEGFPYRDLEALLVSLQAELPARRAPQVEVDLLPDGRLAGTLVSLNGQFVVLEILFAEEPIRIPLTAVRGLRFAGPDHRWLSDLPPVEVEELPYVGDPEVFLYPYRPDRSVTGRPLEVGEQRYAKGFGCHARTRLAFDVGAAGLRWFRAEAGVAEEVGELAHGGSMVFVVRLDGEEVFRSDPQQHGMAPLPIGPLDLSGRQRLELLLDFDGDEDIADRGVWGAPLLFGR